MATPLSTQWLSGCSDGPRNSAACSSSRSRRSSSVGIVSFLEVLSCSDQERNDCRGVVVAAEACLTNLSLISSITNFCAANTTLSERLDLIDVLRLDRIQLQSPPQERESPLQDQLPLHLSALEQFQLRLVQRLPQLDLSSLQHSRHLLLDLSHQHLCRLCRLNELGLETFQFVLHLIDLLCTSTYCKSCSHRCSSSHQRKGFSCFSAR
jgi:hypothetical protein